MIRTLERILILLNKTVVLIMKMINIMFDVLTWLVVFALALALLAGIASLPPPWHTISFTILICISTILFLAAVILRIWRPDKFKEIYKEKG